MRFSLTCDKQGPSLAIPNISIVREATGGIAPQEVSLAAGVAGTLSIHAGDTAGTLTLGAGHGITEGMVIDVHWVDAAGLACCAYGATVGVVDVNDVPFTGAAGDVLPAQDYAIVADEEVAIDVDFVGSKLEALLGFADQQYFVQFLTAVPAVADARALLGREPYFYATGLGLTNALAEATVASIKVSNGSIRETTFLLDGVYNSDE